MIKGLKRWWLRQIIKRKPENWVRVESRKDLGLRLIKWNNRVHNHGTYWEFLRGKYILLYRVSGSVIEALINGSYLLTLWRDLPNVEIRDYHLGVIYTYDIPFGQLTKLVYLLKRVCFSEYELDKL